MRNIERAVAVVMRGGGSMSDRFEVYQAVLEDTGRFQQRFDATVNTNRALILSALGGAISGATGIVTSAVLAQPESLDPSSGGQPLSALSITAIITFALCIFGVLFSRYLRNYVRRSLEVLRVRYDWLKQAEAAPELADIGADLFSYEALHIKHHEQIVEGFGRAQEKFVRATSGVFMFTAAVVYLGYIALLPVPWWHFFGQSR